MKKRSGPVFFHPSSPIPHPSSRPLELYDLAKDLGEAKNIADRHPDVIARIEAYLQKGAHRFDRLALEGDSGPESGAQVSTTRLERKPPPVFRR